MNKRALDRLPQFLDILELDEAPMGIFYTDKEPADGFTPKPHDLPTRKKELSNEIDWQSVFGGFSCVLGNIWRARKKKTAAYFSAEQFGCPGGAFWLGFNKPQTETIIHYVSTGIPNWTDGEKYCESPDELSFTIPLGMFQDMLDRFDTSFLVTKTWSTVKKKIARSQKVWGEKD